MEPAKPQEHGSPGQAADRSNNYDGQKSRSQQKKAEKDTREEGVELEGCECNIVEVKGREGFKKEAVSRVKCHRDFIGGSIAFGN